ncbi:HNH endonuclease [Nonomuraea sp. SMC257]|uniref:HNH endonuclease n=2 Tax=Nonomuraea montanisoli TaxID=2741721 RepID=A0A7Y6I8Z8_9ACTN|nr:HNH endonuclease [Nonomuraea montanisoli]
MKGVHGREFRRILAARDGSRCFYCGTPFEDPAGEATFDHYVPVALWVTRRHSEPWNVVLACWPCNNRKGDLLPWPLVWLLLARFRAQAALERAA